MSSDRMVVFRQRIQPLQDTIVGIQEKSQELLLKYDKLKYDKSNNEYVVIAFDLAKQQLHIMSLLIAQNHCSIFILGTQDTALLVKARRSCFQALVYYESVLGKEIDPLFSTLKQMQEQLSFYDDSYRYYIVQKLGFAIDFIHEACRHIEKLRWYFVDLQARYAIIVRNLLDVTKASAGFMPEQEYFRERVLHSELVQKLLDLSASNLRKKYESSSRQNTDFKRAIEFLKALESFYRLCELSTEEQQLKRKIEIWKAKLISDI